MGATLLGRIKEVGAEGDIIEVVVWRLPAPVPPSEHGFKYRAAFVVGGSRIVGFDNERGKGDHMHVDGEESPYAFSTVEQLIEDFAAAIAAWRAKR